MEDHPSFLARPPTSKVGPLGRTIPSVFLSVVAWSVFGVGLLSPLTPSEGTPSVANWLVHLALPLGVLGWIAWGAVTAVGRLLVLTQIAAMLGSAAALIRVLYDV